MRQVQAIVPNRPARSRPYAWGSISVNPDPPRVGEMTTISFPLKSLDADELVVERIEVKVALFGIGLAWEELGTIGPFRLPPDSSIIDAAIQWTPTAGGHRCIRATLYVEGLDEPLVVGRNLHVFESQADQETWTLPFRLGNPERVAAPLLLHLDGNDLPAIDGIVRISGREAPLDRPVWLEPGQVVEAALVLHAQTEARLNHMRTLEATVYGKLIDGIEVVVRRPGRLPKRHPRDTTPQLVAEARDLALSLTR